MAEEDAPPKGRKRSGSISGRLRSASDLCDEGTLSEHEKGILKPVSALLRFCFGV